jgi:hypothetical protein
LGFEDAEVPEGMPSWRDTLFIWQGSLQGTEWVGRWVGVDSADATHAAAPSAQEYADSANAFAVTLEAGDGGALSAKPGAEAEATAGKGYLLDQDDGEGHSYHRDDAHRIRFFRSEDAAGGALLAGAIGRNEFGPFVSLGSVKGQELMLARRYLDHKDARAAWSLDEIEAAGKAISDASVPWSCEALHSKIQRKGKAPKRKAGVAEPGGSSVLKREKATSEPRKRVRHVVLMKFKADGKQHQKSFHLAVGQSHACKLRRRAVPADTMEAAKASLLLLQGKVDGVERISFGATFTRDRAQGYTHALVVDLLDQNALEV